MITFKLLKGPLSSYLNKVVDTENLRLPKALILKPQPSTIEPMSLKNRRKRYCCNFCAPLGFVPSKVSDTNN